VAGTVSLRQRFRRTDGDAAIPAEAVASFTGPLAIELITASSIRYRDERRRQRVA
jgi:hypothetical protein